MKFDIEEAPLTKEELDQAAKRFFWLRCLCGLCCILVGCFVWTDIAMSCVLWSMASLTSLLSYFIPLVPSEPSAIKEFIWGLAMWVFRGSITAFATGILATFCPVNPFREIDPSDYKHLMELSEKQRLIHDYLKKVAKLGRDITEWELDGLRFLRIKLSYQQGKEKKKQHEETIDPFRKQFLDLKNS